MEVDVAQAADVGSALVELDSLFATDAAATPFSSPGWARAWVKSWAPDAQPWMLRVVDSGSVVGLAPLTLRRRGPLRVLEMLGKEPGDYWDIVAVPAVREAVAAAAAEALHARAHEWDALVINCLPPQTATVEALASARLKIFERPPIPSPRIELPTTFEEYLTSLPRSRRGNLRRHLRRVDEGEIEVRDVQDPAELVEVIQRWRELRALQWEHAGRQLTAEHTSDRFRDFILEVATLLVPAGLAVVWEFRRAEEPIAVYVNFLDDRAFYWYLGGFHPSAGDLGPGKIAIGLGIRSSIQAGRRYFDFTRGAEPYKYWYGASDVHLRSLVVGHSGARSRFLLAAARSVSAYRARRTRTTG